MAVIYHQHHLFFACMGVSDRNLYSDSDGELMVMLMVFKEGGFTEEGRGVSDGDSCLCNCAFLTHREKSKS